VTLVLQCHPFAYGPYMFMHNGIISGFSAIRRKLLEGLSDAAYDAVASFHSDSAVSFALFLSFLPSMDEHHSADVMLLALHKTLEFIGDTQAKAGIVGDTSLLNFVVTDGLTLVATRCVAPSSHNPASLYYAEGTTFRSVRF
jgi:glutamine amidotransferase